MANSKISKAFKAAVVSSVLVASPVPLSNVATASYASSSQLSRRERLKNALEDAINKTTDQTLLAELNATLTQVKNLRANDLKPLEKTVSDLVKQVNQQQNPQVLPETPAVQQTSAETQPETGDNQHSTLQAPDVLTTAPPSIPETVTTAEQPAEEDQNEVQQPENEQLDISEVPMENSGENSANRSPFNLFDSPSSGSIVHYSIDNSSDDTLPTGSPIKGNPNNSILYPSENSQEGIPSTQNNEFVSLDSNESFSKGSFNTNDIDQVGMESLDQGRQAFWTGIAQYTESEYEENSNDMPQSQVPAEPQTPAEQQTSAEQHPEEEAQNEANPQTVNQQQNETPAAEDNNQQFKDLQIPRSKSLNNLHDKEETQNEQDLSKFLDEYKGVEQDVAALRRSIQNEMVQMGIPVETPVDKIAEEEDDASSPPPANDENIEIVEEEEDTSNEEANRQFVPVPRDTYNGLENDIEFLRSSLQNLIDRPRPGRELPKTPVAQHPEEEAHNEAVEKDERIRQLEAQVQALQEQLAEAQQNTDALNEVNEHFENYITENIGDMAQLQNDIGNTIITYRNELDQLEQDHRLHQQTVTTENQQQNENAKPNQPAVNNEQPAETKTYANAAIQTKGLDENLNELQEGLTAARQTADKAAKQKDQLEEQVKQLQEELDEAEKKVKEAAEAEERAKEAAEKNAQLETRVQRLKEQLTEANKKINNLTAQNTFSEIVIKSKAECLEAQSKAKREADLKIQTLQKELNETRNSYLHSKGEANYHKQTANTLSAQNVDLYVKIKELEEQLKAATQGDSAEVEELQARIKELEEQLNTATQNGNAQLQQITELTNNIQCLNAQIQNLQNRTGQPQNNEQTDTVPGSQTLPPTEENSEDNQIEAQPAEAEQPAEEDQNEAKQQDEDQENKQSDNEDDFSPKKPKNKDKVDFFEEEEDNNQAEDFRKEDEDGGNNDEQQDEALVVQQAENPENQQSDENSNDEDGGDNDEQQEKYEVEDDNEELKSDKGTTSDDDSNSSSYSYDSNSEDGSDKDGSDKDEQHNEPNSQPVNNGQPPETPAETQPAAARNQPQNTTAQGGFWARSVNSLMGTVASFRNSYRAFLQPVSLGQQSNTNTNQQHGNDSNNKDNSPAPTPTGAPAPTGAPDPNPKQTAAPKPPTIDDSQNQYLEQHPFIKFLCAFCTLFTFSLFSSNSK